MDVYDKAIEAYTKLPIDLCYTNILKNRLPWEAKFQTRKWSDLISEKRFSEIKNRANTIFDLLEQCHCSCPTVTRYELGLNLRYEEDSKVLEIFILPQMPILYVRGRTDEPLLITQTVDDEAFLVMLPLFCRVLSPIPIPESRKK